MTRFVARRLFRAVITLLIFQTALFLLIQALPWDYVSLTRAPEAYQRVLRHSLGLDLPVWQQYLNWMKGFFTGNLGDSFRLGHMPVMMLFLQRVPRTLLLFLPGTIIGFLLGLWLGKQVAWRRGGWFELGLTLGGVTFYTSFAPWLAFILVNIFALQLGWAPPENMVNANIWAGTGLFAEDVIWWMLLSLVLLSAGLYLLWRGSRRLAWRKVVRLLGVLLFGGATAALWANSGLARFALDIFHHLLLPLATLILLSFGETMLLMRATMIEVLSDDHVLVARAKGISDREVRDRHVARLALLPVLARFIVQLPLVIIGSFVLEKVFFWQGMGELLFSSVDFYDLPVVMGILSLVGILMLVAHVTLDILSAWLDPRLRAENLSSS